MIIYSYFIHEYSILDMTPEKYLFLYNELIQFYTYSEYYEDLLLYSILFDAKNKFYIDVGAFDPIAFSITKSIYIKGWHGINIESQKDKIEYLTIDLMI